jgi:ABC-type hemin transport system substrate-binding protein
MRCELKVSPIAGPPAWLLACAVIVVAAMAGLAGCGERTRPPDAAPDADDKAARIAVLSPAIAVMLRDLDLQDRVVARHAWDLALDPSLPVAGDQTGLDYETLLRARPTHILLEWGSRPLPPRLEDLARRQGWTIHNYRLLTLDDVQRAARDLHERFAQGDAAWDDTALARRMGAALAPRPGLERAGRILLLHSSRPPAALGPGSAHHQVLEALGAIPAVTQGSPFISMDVEDVLRLSPDGILLITASGGPPSGDDRDGDPQPFGRLASLPIPAAMRGRLAVIDHPLNHLPSTSLIEVAERIATVLEGWAGSEAAETSEPPPDAGLNPPPS